MHDADTMRGVQGVRDLVRTEADAGLEGQSQGF